MKPQKPINLSQCKINQRVRLRNGSEARIEEISSLNFEWPIGIASSNDFFTVSKGGRYLFDSDLHDLDVVAILPDKGNKNKNKLTQSQIKGWIARNDWCGSLKAARTAIEDARTLHNA